MKIGNKEFDLKNHAYVMGILNVTPDSFPTAESGTTKTGQCATHRKW